MASKAENPQMFGVWKAYKSENFGAFMEKMGAPWMARKMGANATPTITLTRLDDKRIGFTTKSMIFTSEQVYELDSVVQGSMPMAGSKLDFYTEWSDGRLIVYQTPAGSGDPRNGNVKYIRSLEPNGELLVTAIYGDVTAYRWFKRQ